MSNPSVLTGECDLHLQSTFMLSSCVASLTPSVSHTADHQKASFYAVWNGLSDLQKSLMMDTLRSYVNVQSQLAEGRSDDAKAKMLFVTGLYIGFDGSPEHANNVSQFMVELADLSDMAMREMISMSETDGPAESVAHEAAVQEGSWHENDETSTCAGLASDGTFATTPEGNLVSGGTACCFSQYTFARDEDA